MGGMEKTAERAVSPFRPVIHREGGSYWAEVPAMPGCFTAADTLAELKGNIVEAATAWVESVIGMEMRRRSSPRPRRAARRELAFA